MPDFAVSNINARPNGGIAAGTKDTLRQNAQDITQVLEKAGLRVGEKIGAAYFQYGNNPRTGVLRVPCIDAETNNIAATLIQRAEANTGLNLSKPTPNVDPDRVEAERTNPNPFDSLQEINRRPR